MTVTKIEDLPNSLLPSVYPDRSLIDQAGGVLAVAGGGVRLVGAGSLYVRR